MSNIPGFPPPDLPAPVPTSVSVSSDQAFPPYPQPPANLPASAKQAISIAMCLLRYKIPVPKFAFGFKLPPFPPKIPLPRLPFGVNCFTSALPPQVGQAVAVTNAVLSLLGGPVAPNPLDPIGSTPFGGNRPLLVQPDPDAELGA